MKQILMLPLAIGFLALMSVAAQAYDPPAASAVAVGGIKFNAATALDEDYRAQFKKCDTQDIFRGIQLQGWRKCSGDKNNVDALLKFPGGAVFFESKMSLDLDGSWKACNSPGLADLCPTWYNWKGKTGKAAFVDSEAIAFIVIPIAGPAAHKKEFRSKTGIGAGDFAVVIYDGKVVPAFVADGGPFNKMGEASNAVFKAVGKDRCRKTNADGHCIKFLEASIEGDVLYFVFPGSARSDLTPDNAGAVINEEAMKRFNALKSP